MEGLIPFVYRAIVQYRNARAGAIGSWICESPKSYSYVRLAGGDSDRFSTSASALLSDYAFSATANTAPPPAATSSSSSATQFLVQSSSSSPSLKRRQVSA